MEKQIQEAICDEMTSLGARIIWKKEHGVLAKTNYALSGKKPKINIEALFLGERIVVIIADSEVPKSRSAKYRIFQTDSFVNFREQFEAFKKEKLSQDS